MHSLFLILVYTNYYSILSLLKQIQASRIPYIIVLRYKVQKLFSECVSVMSFRLTRVPQLWSKSKRFNLEIVTLLTPVLKRSFTFSTRVTVSLSPPSTLVRKYRVRSPMEIVRHSSNPFGPTRETWSLLDKKKKISRRIALFGC